MLIVREERRCTAGVGPEKSGGDPFDRQSFTGAFRKWGRAKFCKSCLCDSFFNSIAVMKLFALWAG